jgi:hypothetical protein
MPTMRVRLLLVCILASSSPLFAAEVAVPPELEPWRGWVLHGEEFRRCPFLTGSASANANAFQCAWPERLILNVDARGGRFTQRWQVFAESWVGLPGNLEHWPRDVQVNSTRAAVVARNGVPQLWLTPGTYSLSGVFSWSRRPEALAVPPQTGIVTLTIDGQPIAQPERPGTTVWLGKRRGAAEKPQLELQVYRLVTDDIPVTLTTQIRLQVAGDAREELLAQALPGDFTPLSLTSDLPAKLEPDGRLRVQVRAGTWQIALAARGTGTAESLHRPKADGPWASEEIWSFQSIDRLRIAVVEGVEAVDPVQSNVPEGWREFPSYHVPADAEVRIVERSRGLSAADDNRLELAREIWLDFNHDGYTAVDLIEGQMRQGWRLDLVTPYRLQSARAGQENLLVTEGVAPGATGIELRSPVVDITAVSRIDAGSSMPAAGWQSRFTDVSGTLYLPPGHRLLAAFGADDAPSAWIERWRLLDLFLVLIASLAVGKLLGWRMVALALPALALTHHDSGGMIWLWVNLLIAIVLAREAPEGRLRTVATVYRAVAAVALLAALIPFAANQARLAIYPQLDTGEFGIVEPLPRTVQISAPAEAPMTTESAVSDRARQLEEIAVTGSMVPGKYAAAPPMQRYAPGTVMQTGPGIPDWHFVSHRYSWAGPVDPAQQLRFAIATPFWLSLWRLVGIVLLAALLVVLGQYAFGWPRQLRLPGLPRFGASAATLIAIGALLAPPIVRAESPDPALLNELKSRLTRAPECAPTCAEVTAARVIAEPQSLEIVLGVSALTNAAVPVPAAQGRWEPETISVDGLTNGVLYRDAQQRLWVPLRTGAHELRLTGRIVAAESVQIVFPQQPRSIETRGEGWEISGVSEGRLLTNTLELLRKGAAGPATRLEASMQFPPFVRVSRNVQLGLDWTVATVVERIAPQGGSFTVVVPLLDGESVLTEGIEVRPDGTVLVAMPAGESAVRWTSGLARGESLQLTVADGASHAEVWSFNVSPQWSVQFDGTPPVLPLDLEAAEWSYEFHPRSGEALAVRITKPQSVEGPTLAFDAVALTAEIGKRSTNASLELRYRSTQGGRHVLRLPEDARVTGVTVDGRSIPIRPQNGELPIALSPGSYVLDIDWQSDSGVAVRSRAPAVDVGSASSNIRTRLSLPADRWSLYAFGPGVGPAILFWSELVVFVVLAVLLGRLSYSPLRTREWLLLGLGLSTFSWSVLLLFAAWMFVLRWRSSWQGSVSRGQFNTIQVFIGILSVITLISLVSAIPFGLLASPDMRVRGFDSYGQSFGWFVDQASGALPQPGVISVSLWWYKLAMLAWALWLSFALLRWLPWAWNAFRANGWWRRAPAPSHARAPTPAPKPG